MKLKKVRCNLCRSTKAKLLFKINKSLFYPEYSNANSKIAPSVESFNIVKCLNCSLVYVNPQISFEDIPSSYETYNKEHKPHKNVMGFIFEISNKNRLKSRLKEISRLKPSGKLLDIGSGDGSWMEFAQNNGWDAYGVEIVSSLVNSAKKKGLKVLRGTLEQAKFSSNFFDVITITDVVEHLPDPKAALKEIHRVLKKDGLVVVSTMDIASLNARIAKKYWQYIGLHHLYYFSNKTLKKMLESADFHVVKSRIDNKMLRHFLYFPISLLVNVKNIIFINIVKLLHLNIKLNLVVNYWPSIYDHRILIAKK